MTSSTGDPAKLHHCYLNAERSNTVSHWTDEGCYDEIRLKIGYRFEVRSVEYTPTVSAGGTFSVAVDVENSGWARLHKPRDAKLVLRNGATLPPEYTFSGGPVSNWAPGTTTTISVSDSAPSPGTYSVWLGIPDPDLEMSPNAAKTRRREDAPKASADQTTRASPPMAHPTAAFR